MKRFWKTAAGLLLGGCLLLCPARAASGAEVSRQQFTCNGQSISLPARSIYGGNYVALRPLAEVMGWSIEYDTASRAIYLDTDGKKQRPAVARGESQRLVVDGLVTGYTVCTFDGTAYCSLRDLARLIDFSVIYNGVTNTVELDTQYPYYEQQGNTLILMYHMIVESPFEFNRDFYGTYTTTERFRENIRDLKARGYTCVSLDDYLTGKTVAGKKHFIITFDDGYPSNYALAWPILREEGATATIFDIVERSDWGCVDFLSAEQMREMEASGLVRIGSHTLSHVRCGTLDAAALRVQLADSKAWLDEQLERPTLFLAYPFGSYSKQSYLAAKAAGYRLQLAQSRQFAADDLLVRMDMRYDTDVVALTRTGVHN